MPSSDEFRQFYQDSYGRTLAMVAGLTGSRPEAEDIVQEAYARALARWALLRGYQLPDAWVRKVALRLAIDSGRRHRRRLAAAVRLAAQRPAAAPEPDEGLRYGALGSALLDLPLRLRQVLVLHYIADQPVDAIAGELGLTVGMVKSRLRAGRRHLEERLAQHEEAVGQ